MPWRWTGLRALMPAALVVCLFTAAQAATNPVVEAVQRVLVERGFEPGEVDGAIGSRTRRALEEFQRSVGLPATGRADGKTLEALGLEPAGGASPASEAKAPPPGEASESGRDPVANAAPERDAARVLGFAALGWHFHQTGEEALERFRAIGAPPVFRRGTGSLFVPKPEFVFVLGAGEGVPGLDCDPGSVRLSVEFAFGPDGPAIFTPVAGGEYCQMGIGIVLEVGGTLEMRRIDWGDVQHPPGTVRITNEGLEFAR